MKAFVLILQVLATKGRCVDIMRPKRDLARPGEKKTRPSGQIRPVRFNPDLPVVPSQPLICFASIFLDADSLVEFTVSETTLSF